MLAPRSLTPTELKDLEQLFDAIGDRPGRRVTEHPVAAALLAPGSTLLSQAQEQLGPAARPVRAVLFDKTYERNWGVAWHQDRTIAVKERREVEGFGPWSTKQGVLHVAPPFEVLAGMLTVRAHLDAVEATNAPLVIARRSHRIGVIAADKAAEVAAGFESASCFAKPGDVWLYSTPILHCSKPAAEPRRRRVLQIDFAVIDLPSGLAWAAI
jgi:hypothetical protein